MTKVNNNRGGYESSSRKCKRACEIVTASWNWFTERHIVTVILINFSKSENKSEDEHEYKIASLTQSRLASRNYGG